MCDTCKRIDNGKTPEEMLKGGAVLIGLTKYGWPIFESGDKTLWELVEDPLTESPWFVLVKEEA